MWFARWGALLACKSDRWRSVLQAGTSGAAEGGGGEGVEDGLGPRGGLVPLLETGGLGVGEPVVVDLGRGGGGFRFGQAQGTAGR